MNETFPKSPSAKPCAIRGDIWNRAARVLGKKFSVCPPLMLADGPDTLVLSVFPSSGLPPGGVQYQVIMRPDNTATSAVWDYPRFHN